jgi:hypothetical protein
VHDAQLRRLEGHRERSQKGPDVLGLVGAGLARRERHVGLAVVPTVGAPPAQEPSVAFLRVAGEQVALVIAEDDLRDAPFDQALDEQDDRHAVRPTIDQIAYEDDGALDRAACDVAAEASKQRAEGIDLAMNVADDVDAIGEKRVNEAPVDHGCKWSVGPPFKPCDLGLRAAVGGARLATS